MRRPKATILPTGIHQKALAHSLRSALKITASFGPARRNGFFDSQSKDKLIVVRSTEQPSESSITTLSQTSQHGEDVFTRGDHPGPLSSHPVNKLLASSPLDHHVQPILRQQDPQIDPPVNLDREHLSFFRQVTSHTPTKRVSSIEKQSAQRSQTLDVLQPTVLTPELIPRVQPSTAPTSAFPHVEISLSPLSSPFQPAVSPSSPSSSANYRLVEAPSANQTLTVEYSAQVIRSAQPSAYWDGRFVSLHDRFQSEKLESKNLGFLATTHTASSTIVKSSHAPPKHQRPTHLSASSTTSALHKLTTADHRQARSSPATRLWAKNRLTDDDERCRRIFRHLDALCVTEEARQSLHEWQHHYFDTSDRPFKLSAVRFSCRSLSNEATTTGTA